MNCFPCGNTSSNSWRLKNLLPISIDIQDPNNPKALGFSNCIRNMAQLSPPVTTSFIRYLRTRPSTEQWIIGHILQLTPSVLKTLATSIATGTIIIGSDGSQNHGNSSYSFRIQCTKNKRVYIESHFLIPICTVFSAEGYGHLAALYILPAFTIYYNITPRHLPTPSHRDNKSLIERISHGPEISISHTQPPVIKWYSSRDSWGWDRYSVPYYMLPRKST